MELIIAIIGAIASVIAAYFAVRNDKAFIKKCIRQKKQKIRDIELQKELKYHHKFVSHVTPEDEKINKLKQEIADLEDRL